jgi:hypothetical protein
MLISLADFLERWLPGLERDGLKAGPNRSGERATGCDVDPREVVARIPPLTPVNPESRPRLDDGSRG